ncbi:MAG: RHS repeat-associated core domain-containing protein [Alphaproteobacteria bacterium]|nr:MAG: RHS repeat-associated core domain-containing protein [Alphaproteobacteria bacterium]
MTGITYQPFGAASGWSALGQAHRRSFNLDGHVTGITTPDLNITMGYDQAERLSTLQEGKLGLQRFGYAGNGWLDRYTFTDGITGRYDFDPSGNRTAQRDGVKGTVTSVIAGNSNQVTSVTKNNGKTVPMRHDLAGNLTFDGVQDVELSYDGANRASGVKNKGTQYRYNHADQRVEKLGPGTRGVGKEIYAYDLSGLMGGVYGPDAKPLWETVRLDGAPVAVLGGDNKAYAAHPDYRGAPIRLNGANGAMVWDWQASGPWADVSPLHYTPGLSAAFPFHYRERLPGQFYDDETDMNYNGARIYNMHLGRFNQPDPVLQLDGLSPYAYANNNPVGFVDVDGKNWVVVQYSPQSAANPFGHTGIGSATPSSSVKTMGFYPAYTASTWDKVTGAPVPGIMKWDTDERSRLAETELQTNSSQDALIEIYLQSIIDNKPKYETYNNNCAQVVGNALREGGVPVPNNILTPSDLTKWLAGYQRFTPRPRSSTAYTYAPQP